MPQFMEERLNPNVDYGSGFGSAYRNWITRTIGGDEYRSQQHPFIIATMNVDFERQTNEIVEQVIDLNNRAGGTLRGFRVMHPVDYSTNSYRDAPTAFDQHLPAAVGQAAGVYQLTRWYGDHTDLECQRRRIRKPVAGTVKVGVAGVAYPAGQWSVDITTGLVTMAANKSRSITAITKAASAVLTVGTNTFAIGDSVAISGVVGMTQINGLRALVTAKPSGTTITVAINSTAFTTYASGGTVQTQPITGEAVTAGCEYDIPMRFTEDLSGSFSNWDTIDASGIGLVEVLNP
ncbi:MAG: DUF2460 domain-containing protein [Halopseudomonas sp.]|uniref:DUF2460 domain-containing protein n=1 Tax=Halopseudomonas sp. TaxID=2901191 RepID=UPI003002D391